MVWEETVSVTRDVTVAMRDGVDLVADIYMPEGKGPFPILLMRTPYGKTLAQTSIYANPRWYAERGYIVVIQDVRGRWDSDGIWYPFAHEADDGYDSVEWAAALPRSNGRVGMYGLSYPGATQLLAAIASPPHLGCIVPAMTSSEYYEGWTYRGGALSLGFAESWAMSLAHDVARRRDMHGLDEKLTAASDSLLPQFRQLPLKEFALLRKEGIAPWFFDWLEHPSRDDYWERWSVESRHANVRVPALHIAGWYDIFLDGSIRNFVGLRARAAEVSARDGQRLMVGPWHHQPWTEIVSGWNFGSEARSNVDTVQLRWFDYWLKGVDNGVAQDPPVQVFVMGANRWRQAQEWPPEGIAFTILYLHSDGIANSLNGDGTLCQDLPGAEEPDRFTYNPTTPVMSLGGRSCCSYQNLPMGPADQWQAEIRTAVLVYTTAPLAENLEVAGPVTVILYAATTARDTDWTAKLVDVDPDGRAINVADGILRARYRVSLSEPTLLEPNQIYEYRIDLGSTDTLFTAGHCLRLDISSSNFPTYDRNLNTGGKFGEESIYDHVVATQTVFHDVVRPSQLILPVISGD